MGYVAWPLTVGSSAVFRRRRGPDDPIARQVDPAQAPRRLAPVVADALDARRRYQDLVAGLRPGPVQERLGSMQAQLDAGVLAVGETARRVGELERILASLQPDRVTDEYKRAKRSDADPEVMAAHEARFGSVQRLLNAVDDADERLRLLDVRLDGIVARGAEVALGSGGDLDALDAELASVVSDLGALRAGLDAVGGV
jgi:hypothetical protein